MKKKNIYDGVLSFKGTWRNYQRRVLEEVDQYLEDGKIHIAAAPGAGKTTLGIELIRRTGTALPDPFSQDRDPGAVAGTYPSVFSGRREGTGASFQ